MHDCAAISCGNPTKEPLLRLRPSLHQQGVRCARRFDPARRSPPPSTTSCRSRPSWHCWGSSCTPPPRWFTSTAPGQTCGSGSCRVRWRRQRGRGPSWRRAPTCGGGTGSMEAYALRSSCYRFCASTLASSVFWIPRRRRALRASCTTRSNWRGVRRQPRESTACRSAGLKHRNWEH